MPTKGIGKNSFSLSILFGPMVNAPPLPLARLGDVS